ncbi:MAG: VanW family protein [Hyphomonadaceae bacterium]|nr:VanW family protein [Clostridia bacterium]
MEPIYENKNNQNTNQSLEDTHPINLDDYMEEAELRMAKPVNSKQNWLLIGIVAWAALLILSIMIFQLFQVANYPYIYAGVMVGSKALGGLSQERAQQEIEEKMSARVQKITLNLIMDDKSVSVKASQLNITTDAKKMAEEAWKVGRTGNLLQRATDAAKIKQRPVNIPVIINIDTQKLQDATKGLTNSTTLLMQPTKAIDGNNLVIKNGQVGKSIDVKQATERIVEALGIDNKDMETPIDIPLKMLVQAPDKIDVQSLQKEFVTEPKDASYGKENGQLKVIPHVVGVTFNVDDAAKIIAQNDVSLHPELAGKSYSIPIALTMPTITKEKIGNDLFSQSIGKFNTRYDTSLSERSRNIELASKKINGTVFLPGEVFSYNQVVGKRTAEAGFQIAKVFVSDQVAEGIGGGICQVSSTLYNACLKSDMQIVERANHSLAVTYVPLGQDAAVSYGSLDYQFRNNTQFPIKLVVNASAGSLTCDILGSQKLDKTVRLEHIKIADTPFATNYENIAEWQTGKTVTKQRGNNGLVLDTYKIIEQGGKQISRAKITQSVYQPFPQIIQRGTKNLPVQVAPPPVVEQPQPPQQTKPEVVAPEQPVPPTTAPVVIEPVPPVTQQTQEAQPTKSPEQLPLPVNHE